jgi:hypothetical protein
VAKCGAGEYRLLPPLPPIYVLYFKSMRFVCLSRTGDNRSIGIGIINNAT